MLRSYFEPTEEERQSGQKLPTAAHRAIAQLVAKGYVRVIVTTNFDRLIEQALTDEGVQATVISTSDAVVGAMPITHSPCTLIKVHGDYLDSRLKNTRDELATYDGLLNNLLDRIFDEFGLVISGWSGEWDIALRSAIERVSNHRFGTYWTTRSKPGPVTEKLIALRRASTIVIPDADSFFKDLSDKIQAIEQFALTDPVSPRVAVARLKRYLRAADQEINLHDLLVAETERVYKSVRGDRYPTSQNIPLNPSYLKERLSAYESEVSVLLPLMICGGYWATPSQSPYFSKCLKRLADHRFPSSGAFFLLALRLYPALLLFYGAGIASLARGNYDFFRRIFNLTVRGERDGSEVPITKALNAVTVIDPEIQKTLPGYESSSTPLSDHLFAVLRDPLREYVPDDAIYDETFDWFEYLLALIHCDRTTSTEDLQQMKTSGNWNVWGPPGRFVGKGIYSGSTPIRQKAELRAGQPYPPHVGSLLKAGFFGSDGRYSDLKRGFDATVARMASQMM